MRAARFSWFLLLCAAAAVWPRGAAAPDEAQHQLQSMPGMQIPEGHERQTAAAQVREYAHFSSGTGCHPVSWEIFVRIRPGNND